MTTDLVSIQKARSMAPGLLAVCHKRRDRSTSLADAASALADALLDDARAQRADVGSPSAVILRRATAAEALIRAVLEAGRVLA